MDLQQSIMQINASIKSFEKKNHHQDRNNKTAEANVAAGDWKKIGNEHFAFKRYTDAVAVYTKGIEGGDTSIDLLANRAGAYLAITKYRLALVDVEAALTIDENHIKCIYRKVRALFGLKLYKEAAAYMQTIILESIPSKDRHIITDLMIKGKSFIAQSKNGEYPWYDLHISKSVYHDMADFTGSVILKESPMKGRGLFASKSIKAGELILASKAFAYLQDIVTIPSPGSNPISNQWSQTDLLLAQINMQLVHKTLQILDDNPDRCRELYTLYPGPDFDHLYYEDGAVTNDFRLDVERVESLSLYNRISNHDECDGSLKRNSGIWIFPSFLNHDCIDANSSWLNIGDFLFVRAYRNISEGEEILISYQAPNGLIAQNELDMYEFTCTCRLCERDRLDNRKTRTERAKLFSQLQIILRKFDIGSERRMAKEEMKKVLRILKSFEATRTDEPELNFCLINELMKFGMLRMECFEFLEAAETFENIYKMTKNVPAYLLNSVEACIHVVEAYVEADKISKGKKWIGILKKAAVLAYGNDKILHVHFPTFIEFIREKGLDHLTI